MIRLVYSAWPLALWLRAEVKELSHLVAATASQPEACSD